VKKTVFYDAGVGTKTLLRRAGAGFDKLVDPELRSRLSSFR
jgi:hypothetical protein